VSRNKILALRDLARHTLSGTVPELDTVHGLADDELIERLSQVRGIGRWTVEMLLMFRLGRPDVLPTADLGVRKGFARTYGLPDLPEPKALHAHGERWRPYRTVASWYLWRSLELPG
jgi:DNA-3-methyladenine glycosylase II